MSEKKTNRRDFLFTATYAVGAVGLAATVWPMIDQMNPDASVKALASTEVDVSSLTPGKTITVLWRGKPVFIRRRTQEEITDAKSVKMEDLKDPEYEALGFDYVEPHTWDNQPEGYWRWQFSWGGPSDELRGYVNEHRELHRLEYWYLDWGDGAHVQVAQDAAAWQQMQEMIG